MTWQEVRDVGRDVVVVIPAGSLEQHGPHLPLFTDTILATAVAEGVERRLPEQAMLTPALWLGASGHHLAFPGTLSASFDAFIGALESIVGSLEPHGFHKFYVVNGHGGNNDPLGVALRGLKLRHPNLTLGASGYYSFAAEQVARLLEGPIKTIRHACEAEASLMMHVRPDLVRTSRLRDDGLSPEPPVVGVVHHFDEVTDEGSFGYATLATPEKGRAIFEAAVEGLCREIQAIAEGYALIGP